MPVQYPSEEELDQLATEWVEALPPFDPEEETIALAVHRLLAEGDPVPERRISEATGLAPERITGALDRWPGFVFRDERGDITGFFGLTREALSPHRLEVAGRPLWAWCSVDTLFLPVVLGQEARIESVCATTGEPVTAVVGPDGVREVSPTGAVTSFLHPDGPVGHDVIASFCHHVFFFASEEAGEQWISDRNDLFLITLEQGFELGRRVWEAKYAAALASEQPS